MLRPTKNDSELQLLTPEGIAEQFGVPPAQFTQFLTLTGDTSDNIPGAKGIGPKTAATLLGRFGSLEKVYEKLEEIAPRTRASLEEFRPRLPFITDLVTIRTNLELPVTLQDLACTTPDSTAILCQLKELELKTIARRLPDAFPGFAALETSLPDGQTEPEEEETDPLGDPREGSDYRMISTEEDVRSLVARLMKAKLVAVDTETTSLNTFEAELAGISLSATPGTASFISFSGTGLSRENTIELLRPLLENPTIPKTGQNLKYDLLVFKKYRLELFPVSFDSMLASYLLNPEVTHNMDDLAARHLGLRTTKYDELTGKGKRNFIFTISSPESSPTTHARTPISPSASTPSCKKSWNRNRASSTSAKLLSSPWSVCLPPWNTGASALTPGTLPPHPKASAVNCCS